MAMHTASAASDNSSVAGKRCEHNRAHGSRKAHGLSPIAAREARKISHVLHAERLIESERMAELRKILDARILAEHLQHGIARHNVDHQKNHREDEPKSRQRVKETLKEMPDHLGLSTFSAAGFVSAAGAEPARSASVFNRWILTRATLRRSISTTVKR